MIKSFLHKGLRELFAIGRSASVPPALQKRCIIRLDILNAAKDLRDLNLPGFGYHPLKGGGRHALSVNGPWRITFEWRKPDALLVDLQQYH